MPYRSPFTRLRLLTAVGALFAFSPPLPAIAAEASALGSALTFHAPFDGGPDASFALGDPQLYHAPSMKHPRTGVPGLPASKAVTLAPNEGRFGDALRFHKKTSEIVFFQGKANMAYQPREWNGTVSFWLKLDPDKDLEPGYCDPIQITPREWNDAAFFVEFGKDETPRHFRLGAYADFKVWNPSNRDWEAIPFAEKPLVSVTHPPFRGDRWAHVAFTFTRFNTGEKNGTARLYLDGKLQGELSAREQTFSWDPSKVLIMLGLSYIGLFDDLALFNRALSEAEITSLYQLKNGVGSLSARQTNKP